MNKIKNDPWIPSNALEEEVVSLQPQYNFIFGSTLDGQQYSAPAVPKSFLEHAKMQWIREDQIKQLLEPLDTDQRDKLSTIIKVQNVIHTKPLGEMVTVDDWKDGQQCERDTIAMMRRLHLAPSMETPLNSACTIGTVSAPEDYKLIKTRNGKFPVFLGENFFKMSPASSERDDSSISQTTNSSPRTESEEVSDLIKFSTTENSFNSAVDDSGEIAYQNLSNCSNCSTVSASSYGYGPTGAHPLSSYISPLSTKQRHRKGKHTKTKK